MRYGPRTSCRAVFATVIVLFLSTEPGLAEQSLSYGDLVGRLYDLEALATPPLLGERSGTWTSADRDARFDVTTKRYQRWWANRDGSGAIRTEGDHIVAAEMKGPGVIWRVWSAMPRAGHVKISIDGETTPALDIPFAEFFNWEKEPFTYPELVGVYSNGRNNFVPIAYQESCKIVLEKGWGAYFQFTFTTFPKGTALPSFQGSFSEEEQAALRKANEILGRRGTDASQTTLTEEVLERNVTVRPGATVQVASLHGPRAITALEVEASLPEDREQEMRILRELTLRMTWDDDGKPAVWAPLGDFFATAPGVNEYRALPMGMTKQGFYSRWYMPFSSRAVVEVTNDGSASRSLTFRLSHRPEKNADGLLRFHAKWHREAFPGRDPERYLRGDRWPDWPVLITAGGQGRFCGFHLHVWNPNPVGTKRQAIPGGWGDYDTDITEVLDGLVPQRWWWGEGDEKFFVDGEPYPSTFGTGSEDYFGYAFAAFHPDPFDSAFQSLPLNQNNYGHISNVRFQIADNVPFQESFEAVIEKYHPKAWPLLYSAVAYWYQAPGVVDPYGPVSAAERVDYYVDVARETDVLEAEQLPVLHHDSGVVVFDGFHKHFSADHSIVWKDIEKSGDRLLLELPVESAGTRRLLVQVGENLDAGSFQLYLDGKILGEPFDLGAGTGLREIEIPENKMFFEYSPYAARLKKLDFGVVSLSQGIHTLGFEATEPGRKNGYLLTLDYVRLGAER